MNLESLTSQKVKDRTYRLLDGGYRGEKPLQTLLLILKGQEKNLTLAAVAFTIKQSPMWLLPIITRNVLNAAMVTSAAGLHTIIVWGLIAAVVVAQNIPTHTYYMNMVSTATRDSQRDLRSAIVVRLQQLSIAFHDDTQAGRLQNKMLRDVDNVGLLFRSGFEVLLSATTICVVVLVVAFVRSPVVAVFFLLTAPLGGFLVSVFRKKLSKSNQAFRRDLEDVSVRVNEMIEMLPVTRAHAAESRETGRMRRQLARLTASGRRMDITTERFAAASWVTFNAFQVGCLLFCAMLVRDHRLTVGDLVMFQAYFAMIIGLVSSVLGMLPQFTAGAESIRSIGEVLEAPNTEIYDGMPEVNTIHGELVFDNVSYSYPNSNRPALSNFSLTVAPGECVALVGESGSGKSTLLNLTIGFRRPDSGRILLDGVDMAELNLRSFRRQLAIVPQNTVLFSGTVRENITYGLDDVSEARLAEALTRANCTDFVDRLPQGLETVIGPHGGKLSGGQRQRIAIARALLRDPRMLILDEATSALDAMSEHAVQKAISELIIGRTTIIVAHRLSTLKTADRIVVLKDGKIIEEGNWAELMGRKETAFAGAYALQTA